MALTFAAYAAPPGLGATGRDPRGREPRDRQLVRRHPHGPAHADHRRRRAPLARGRGGRRRRGPRRARLARRRRALGGRLVRHPAGGRPALLRVRRLRAHRHDGRGGARSRAHDPARDRARARGRRRRLRGGRRSRCCRRSARRRRRSRRSRSSTRSSPPAGTGRSRSSASARPRHPSARSSPSSPGIGRTTFAMAREERPPPIPRGRPPALEGAAPRRGRRRGDRHRDRRVRRHPRRDRLLVVRRAAVLPGREPRRLPAAAGRAPLPAGAAGRRGGRMRHPRRHPAVAERGRRAPPSCSSASAIAPCGCGSGERLDLERRRAACPARRSRTPCSRRPPRARAAP